ncbi:hypothetical protein BH09MYX1_BH09MYX1_66530 [soil metagenome]
MKTTVDERLEREAFASALRFRCDDCVHFGTETGSCVNGYPTAPHRVRVDDVPRPLEIVFCKEFELA